MQAPRLLWLCATACAASVGCEGRAPTAGDAQIAEGEGEEGEGEGEGDTCAVSPPACVDCADCAECVDEKCADLFPYCEEDPECVCMLSCLREAGVAGVDACLTQLGLANRPTGFAQLEECVAFACPDDDECATPAAWTPPDADLTCDESGTGGLAAGAEADCAFDAIPFDPLGSVLQLESLAGDFCMRIERQDNGVGELQNTDWSLLDVRVGPLGAVAHVSGATDMCWYSSHHNFRDVAHVWSGQQYFELILKEDGHGGTEEGHDGARRYHLYVFDDWPAEPAECAPAPDGVGCVAGPLLLYGYEP